MSSILHLWHLLRGPLKPRGQFTVVEGLWMSCLKDPTEENLTDHVHQSHRNRKRLSAARGICPRSKWKLEPRPASMTADFQATRLHHTSSSLCALCCLFCWVFSYIIMRKYLSVVPLCSELRYHLCANMQTVWKWQSIIIVTSTL